MPLDRDKVEIGVSEAGDTVIFCKHCHKPADPAVTVQNGETEAYELKCPYGKETLGNWNTPVERDLAIAAYLDSAPKRGRKEANIKPRRIDRQRFPGRG
jgi:hypothetical protein